MTSHSLQTLSQELGQRHDPHCCASQVLKFQISLPILSPCYELYLWCISIIKILSCLSSLEVYNSLCEVLMCFLYQTIRALFQSPPLSILCHSIVPPFSLYIPIPVSLCLPRGFLQLASIPFSEHFYLENPYLVSDKYFKWLEIVLYCT